jgi:hypothetical protein
MLFFRTIFLNDSIVICPIYPLNLLYSYLLLVYTSTQLTLDRSFLFDPFFETCHMDIFDRSRTMAWGTHFRICISEIDTYTALVFVILTEIGDFDHRPCGIVSHRSIQVAVIGIVFLFEPPHSRFLYI